VPAFVGCKVLEALPIRTGEERVAAALFEGVWEGREGSESTTETMRW